MSNPEKFPQNPEETTSSAESLKYKAYKERGEKTMSAAERAEKMKRREEIKKRLAEIEAQEAKKAAESSGAAEPSGTTEAPKETESSETSAPIVAETTKKAKKNSALRTVFISATAIALAGAIGLGIVGGHFKKTESTPTPTPTSSTYEEIVATGEEDDLKLKYDYTEWADFEHKSSHNAYGTDYSDCYGDDEKTTAGFLQKAESMPEALASYKSIFFEDEQKELGIWDMTEKELEEYMSDEDSPEAAAMQQKLLDAIAVILNDKENTKWEYNYENEDENSYYVIWEDANSDGTQTPDEMHLGYSTVKRHNAPQANLYRRAKDKDGNWVKVLDLNLYCGFQPNTPAGKKPNVPLIPEDDPGTGLEDTGSEGTGEEGTGSEGEDTGSEGTGEEGTGSEGTGSEGEDTGTESEGTGTESEGTGTESEGTGTEGTGTESTGTENEGTGSEESLTPKSEETEIINAGPDVAPLELDETVTPKTILEEDQANFEAIRKQQEEDAAKKAEAERVAAEQAEAERKAAEEAEARRQAEEATRIAAEKADAEAAAREAEAKAAADEALAKAQAEAEAAQAAAAETERQRADEEAARAAAQKEANRKAEEERQHAEEMSTNDESRDAADWAAGEFDLGGGN